MMKIVCVVGTRPNFMKMAPIWRALSARPGVFQPVLVHTGQHYDFNMQDVFFQDLGLPAAAYNLGVGSGSPAEQFAPMLLKFEQVLLAERPQRVLVLGDVNSTLGPALCAANLRVPVDHVEAGLRCFDRDMPEEIIRVVTDHLSELLFVTEEAGVGHLLREGRPAETIHMVGNVMIDSLLVGVERARTLKMSEKLGLHPKGFLLATLHRQANVDDKEALSSLLRVLLECAERLPVVWPVHPRTRGRLEAFGLLEGLADSKLMLLAPLGYLEFLSLMIDAVAVLTDSGGVQGETTGLGVPCLTLHRTTEQPVTIEVGTNTLVPDWTTAVPGLLDQILGGRYKQGRLPPLWDGRTAERIADVLETVAK